MRSRVGTVLPVGALDGPLEPSRGFPFPDVGLDLLDKTGRHVHLTLSEGAGYAQDQPLFGADLLFIHLERIDEPVVVPLEILAHGLVLVTLGDHLLVLCLPGDAQDFGELELQGLHVVENIFGQALLFFLPGSGCRRHSPPWLPGEGAPPR